MRGDLVGRMMILNAFHRDEMKKTAKGALHEAPKDALDRSPIFSSSSIWYRRRDDPHAKSARRSSFGAAHLVKIWMRWRVAVHPVALLTLLGGNGSSGSPTAGVFVYKGRISASMDPLSSCLALAGLSSSADLSVQ